MEFLDKIGVCQGVKIKNASKEVIIEPENWRWPIAIADGEIGHLALPFLWTTFRSR